jgi:hypothetical protein
MLQLAALPNIESYLPALYVPIVFNIFLVTTNCSKMHVYITGSFFLLYIWIIICFLFFIFCLIFRFLFVSFLSFYLLTLSFPLISFRLFVLFFYSICAFLPVPVAARSKAQVYGRSPAAIVGSNPTGGIDVCLLWCCQVEISATSWLLVRRSPTDCGASLCVIKEPRERRDQSTRWAAEPEKIIIKYLFIPNTNFVRVVLYVYVLLVSGKVGPRSKPGSPQTTSTKRLFFFSLHTSYFVA